MTEARHGREISLDEMLALRATTEAVASWARRELEDRLEALRPVMLPRRFLGENIKSTVREDVQDADKIFEQVQTTFREASGDPLKIASRLDSPIDSIPPQIVLHEWEYAHEATSGAEKRRLTVKSPLSFIVAHASNLTFAQVRQILSGEAQRNDAGLRQFAIHSVLMKVIFDRAPALGRLLSALRYQVETVHSADTGKLPLVRITYCVPTFRPADKVILSAVRLSGVPIFEELVDVEAASEIADPVKEKLASIASAG